MKRLLLPLILLLSLFSQAAFSVTVEAAINGDTTITLQHKLQKKAGHCATHVMPTVTEIPHSKSSHPMPLDCEEDDKCCAQNCYSQLQLYLHSICTSTISHHSFLHQHHNFSLVQGINQLIERPPKA